MAHLSLWGGGLITYLGSMITVEIGLGPENIDIGYPLFILHCFPTRCPTMRSIMNAYNDTLYKLINSSAFLSCKVVSRQKALFQSDPSKMWQKQCPLHRVICTWR